jgi:hypothetical protein
VLIQRIFNDPAFGLQGRVDAVLQPRPPLPPLPLSDYLENLGIVKEKLGALYVLYSYPILWSSIHSCGSLLSLFVCDASVSLSIYRFIYYCMSAFSHIT